MNTASFFRPVMLACAAAGMASVKNSSAQEFNQPEDSGYYLRFGAATRFGAKANVSAARPVLPAGVYNNGFVLPDVGGGDQTWNWGYTSASQVQGNELVFSRYDNLPVMGRQDLDEASPLFGGELVGGIDMLEFTIFDRTAKLAIELGYGFSTFSSDLNSTSTGTATYTVRGYNFGGIVLPQPPYSGTFEGPGPVIDANPSSETVFTSPATTMFNGSLETFFHELRLGPAVNVALNGRWTIGVGAGYSSVLSDSTLRYDESTTFTDPSIPTATGRGDINHGRWSPGAYAELRTAYQINRHLSAYLGADVSYHKDVSFGDDTYRVNLDLGSTYGLKVGLGYRF